MKGKQFRMNFSKIKSGIIIMKKKWSGSKGSHRKWHMHIVEIRFRYGKFFNFLQQNTKIIAKN